MKIASLVLLLLFLPLTGFAQLLDYVPGEVIVKFKSPRVDAVTLGKSAANAQITHAQSINRQNLHRFSMKTSDSMDDVLRRLKDDPEVEYAEPDYYLHSYQQAYSATSAAIGVVESWSLQTDDNNLEPPVIAVIDSGVDINHRVFKNTGRLWTNPNERSDNGYDDDRNGYADDLHGWNFILNNPDVNDPTYGTGHGTHVSGIALGVSEEIINFKPENAPAAKVQIMALKFLDGNGAGKTSNAVAAIYYAADNGAHIINNSWGGRNYSSALHEALTYAYNKGLLIVSAAGNDGTNNDIRPMYPASYDVPSMISVAATDDNDRIAEFSNYGERSVHVAAPGEAILSIIPTRPDGTEDGWKSGTSMAAPFIAGLGAVMLREAPGLTGFQLKQKILETSRQIPRLEDYVEEKRRMHAQDGVAYAKLSQKEAPYQPYYSPNLRSGSRGLASADLAAQGFGCGTVRQMYTDANQNLTRKNPAQRPTPIVLVLLSVPLALALGLKWKFRQHERRTSERKRVFMPAQIITGRGFVMPAQVLCWSAGGAGVQIHADDSGMLTNEEDRQNLTLRIKSKLGNVVVSSAQVVREDGSGYLGIKFNKHSETE